MNCSRCGRAIAGVFPGTKVTCACGAENVAQAPAMDPYREPAPAVASRSKPEEIDSAPKKERRHPCPRCRLPLGQTGAGVLACGGCEGTFFSATAVESLVDRARNEGELDTPESLHTGVSISADASSDIVYLPCPICSERMNRAIFGRKSGIVVDVCPRHGTWFDHGEVEIAVRFARKHDVFAEPPKAPLTADQIQRRAELEALHMKDLIEGETADAAWRAHTHGFELTFIERLAIAIRWLRGD